MGRWMEGQKVPQNSQEKMKYKKEKKILPEEELL